MLGCHGSRFQQQFLFFSDYHQGIKLLWLYHQFLVAISITFLCIFHLNGVKHLKHQILTLDVKIWCWTSIWRFLTSNINFWRPKSNIWRPTSIFDVLRQIWHQYLTSNIKYLTSNIKYLMFSIKYWCWTLNIDAKFDVGRQKLMLDVKYLT